MKIYKLEETSYSYEDVLELIHLSFEERAEQGIFFTCCNLSMPDFIREVEGSKIFVAIDDKGRLVGTGALRIYDGKVKYGYNFYVAVHPSCKRSGIGTVLLKAREEYALSEGCKYILSDTSVRAKSSVRWHLKNGFRIYGMTVFKNVNYYSYLFRKRLPEGRKRFPLTLSFFHSAFIVVLNYRSGGDRRRIAALYSGLKHALVNRSLRSGKKIND